MSIFNLTANSSSARMQIFKFDPMNQNQGRSFGPLLSLFLMNVLAKAVMAKYDSYYPYQFNYDYAPWLPSFKPPSNYLPGAYFTDWHPIKNPYHFEHYVYPTLTTTALPLLSHDHVAEYDDYEYDSRTQDPRNYDLFIPAESNHIQKQTVVGDTKTTNAPQHQIVFPKEDKVSVKDPKDNSLRERIVAPTRGHKIIPTTEDIPTTIFSDKDRIIPAPESTTIPVTTSVTPFPVTTLLQSLLPEELIAAASNTKVRRQPTQKYKRRGPTRNDRYSQKRRRTTTPAQDYYDSYEDDYTERYQPNRKRRPQYSSSELYYDTSSEYYDSFETTTRYYKKQKRRPTRKVTKINKNHNRNDDSFEIETNTERINPVNPNTEIVIVRQAAPTTTPGTTTTTTTTGSSTTTTEPMTVITNSTSTPGTTTTTPNNTIGYGPSNGNEHVSFTYGPPTNNYQYQLPYVDWYTHEATKNAIVKRVRDIVDIDTRL